MYGRGLECRPNLLQYDLEVGDREIIKVDREHVDWRYRCDHIQKKDSQDCGDPVDLRKPHGWASIWLEASIKRFLFKRVFCEKECWLAWLGGEVK